MRRLHSASTQDTEEDGFEHRLRRKIDDPFSPIKQISKWHQGAGHGLLEPWLGWLAKWHNAWCSQFSKCSWQPCLQLSKFCYNVLSAWIIDRLHESRSIVGCVSGFFGHSIIIDRLHESRSNVPCVSGFFGHSIIIDRLPESRSIVPCVSGFIGHAIIIDRLHESRSIVPYVSGFFGHSIIIDRLH